jgi:tRNA-dihydrouridine synthase C
MTNAQLNTPYLMLAPMEGVTDVVIRDLVTSLGGIDLCVSEFMRVSIHPIPERVMRKYIPEAALGWRTPSGTPILPQLLGSHPGRMATTAQTLEKMGATGIDLNFGCPAKTVNRNEGGAALLKKPQVMKEVIQAVQAAVRIPVSVKMRLGWENPDDVFDICAMLDTLQTRWIAVHARTKEEMYRPPAHWHRLAQLRKTLKTPLIANGDIFTPADFEKCREVTGCDHFMVGRAILRDPWIFCRIRGEVKASDGADLAGILKRFVDLCEKHYPGGEVTVGRFKQFIKQIAIGDPRYAGHFDTAKVLQTRSDVDGYLKNFSTASMGPSV